MVSGSHDPAALQEFRTALATRDPKTVATYLTTMRDFVSWLATQPGGTPFHFGLVSSDQNLADLHDTLQIVMGWDDSHLHRFLIHGRAYGIARDGGLWFRDDPKRIRLSDLHLRIKERFLYEYDFHACWQHQIRLERTLPFDPTQTYPVCIGGARQVPPESCNGALAYLEHKQYFSIGHIGRRLLEIVEDEEARVGDYQEEAATMLYWLQAETFDRSATNRHLARFAAGEKHW